MEVKKEVNSLRSWELKRTIQNTIVHFNSPFNSPFNSHFNSLLILFLLFLPATGGAQDSLRFSIYYVPSHQVGFLQWNALPGEVSYSLYRHLPGENGYALCATLSDTQYYDTLHRVVCADTVGYYLAAGALRSDTVGLYYEDNVPTSPCHLRLAEVCQEPDEHLLLSWYASPDTDVMGYYICMGNPCRDFDTVWGRTNTSYHCSATLNPHAEHSFRVLAFDSCFQASPLTPYYHNPILHLSAEPCSRTLHAQWNRYIHMPDSVATYLLSYRLVGPDSTTLHQTAFPADACPFACDLEVPDLDILAVEARVSAVGHGDSLLAHSCWERLDFDRGDTAAYARIASAVYDETLPAVHLTFDVDSAFPGREYYLMRASAADTTLRFVATLSSPAPYTDLDVNRAALHYVYRLDAPDLCHQRTTRSDTLGVDLPPLGDITAFLPNIIRPGDPALGLFCPQLLSPLAMGFSLDIYNRWGLRMWHTESLGDCWDGTCDRNPVPQGTYVYRLHVCHADGTNKTYIGNITVIK